MGLDIHVASFRAAPIAGVTVHRLPTGGLGKAGYLLAVPVLRRLAATLAPDVVHAHYVTSYGAVSALAGLRPLVVTAWGSDVLVSPQRSGLLRWFARRALRDADLVTVVAEHMSSAVESLGVARERIVALPFGVDCEFFRPALEPSAEPPPWRAICTRNFAPVYSVDTLVQATSEARGLGLEMRLDLAGAGPLEPMLRAQVDALGLAGTVRFLGHLDHAAMVRELGAHHVFVSPARSDGNNISLNEAMACGCFPIATDIPANRQWITDGVNGLLYPPGDASALVRCLLRIAAAPAWRAKAATENRLLVEQRANWRANLQRMMDLYGTALARRDGLEKRR